MGLFLCFLAALAGLAIMVYGIFLVVKSMRARSWPTAQGKVIDSRVREVSDSDGISYEAYVLYEYSVNGVRHRSDVWRLGVGRSSFTGAAKKAVAKYPVGAPVMVYVNPDKPSDAMLEAGNASLALVVFGLAFFLGGANVVLHILKII